MTDRQLEEVIAEIIQNNLRFFADKSHGSSTAEDGLPDELGGEEYSQADFQDLPAELEALVVSLLTTSELVNGSNLGQIRKEVRFQIRLHELKTQRPAIAD